MPDRPDYSWFYAGSVLQTLPDKSHFSLERDGMFYGEHPHTPTKGVLFQVLDLCIGNIARYFHDDPVLINERIFPEIELGGIIKIGLDFGFYGTLAGYSAALPR